MAVRKPSAHTRRRHARAHLADFEAQRASLERSRPRTRGKKAAKTRALNRLVRQISAAKGQITKALRAIAGEARARKSRTSTTTQKRSEAAKKGWATRRARTTPAKHEPAPSSKSAMPFLTVEKGVVGVWPPSKDERSKVGRYWNAVDTFLGNGSTLRLDELAGDAIYDELSGQRLPFVTDPDVIYAHSEEYIFGISLYRDRHEFTRFA